MFFIHRPVSRFHTYRPDYYQQSPEERYYRELAEEHNRRADLALRLAHQERQRALCERELRSIRARQHQEELARRSQLAPQHWNRPGSQLYHVRDSPSAFDLVLSFANEPTRSYPSHPAHRPQPSAPQHYGRQRSTSFFDQLLQTLDVLPEPENERAVKRQVRFGPEQCAPATHTQPAKHDKGKGRAPAQEEPTRPPRQDVPKPANSAPSFWDFFGGLQALEEEDAIVRQLNLFGERSYPGAAQQGVAGPSGTKHTKPAEPSKLSTPNTSAPVTIAKPSIPVPINTTRSSPSAPSSAASSPKSHAGSFTSLDAIQSRFDVLKSSFVFPVTPQFESATATSSGVPRLSYSSSNTSVHEYENELTKLLTKLDAVDSDGAESIRGARKALVVAVEKELDKLDEEKKTAWRNSVVEVETAAGVLESNTVPEAPLEPREDASQVDSTWIPASSVATGEEVRGYEVDDRTAEEPIPASNSEEPESLKALQPVVSEENPIAPSDSIIQVEAADPIAMEEVETPSPAVRAGAPEAPEQVPTVQGQHTDSGSHNEDERVALAGEQRHPASRVEPFADVQQASPAVSEASLGGFDNVAMVEETIKEPSNDTHASDDEFEIL